MVSRGESPEGNDRCSGSQPAIRHRGAHLGPPSSAHQIGRWRLMTRRGRLDVAREMLADAGCRRLTPIPCPEVPSLPQPGYDRRQSDCHAYRRISTAELRIGRVCGTKCGHCGECRRESTSTMTTGRGRIRGRIGGTHEHHRPGRRQRLSGYKLV